MAYSQEWLEDSTRARGLFVIAKRKPQAPEVPSLFLDFINSGGTIDPRITFTRASSAAFTNSKGLLEFAEANVPRIDHDPTTLAPLGLLVEETRTNYIRNNTMVGAVVGVPGTLPTNWNSFTNGATGISTTVVSISTYNGVPCIELRISGTPSANGTTFISFDTTANLLFSPGTNVSGSAYLQLAAGSLTNVGSTGITLMSYDSGGFISQQVEAVALTNNLLKFSNNYITEATSDRVYMLFSIGLTSGLAIDLTVLIGLPQLEIGTFPTSSIKTTNAAVTRSADVVLVNTLSPWFNATEYTLAYEGTIKYNTNDMVLLSIGGANINNTSYLYTDASGVIWGTTKSAGVNSANITSGVTFTSGEVLSAAWAAKATLFNVAANGILGTTDVTGSMPVSNSRLGIGNAGWSSSGGQQGQQWVQKVSVYATAIPTTSLDIITTEEENVYLSNSSLITQDSLVVFEPLISKNFIISEALGLDNTPSVSYGDIELSNPNGAIDDWLDSGKYVWSNREIKIYFGDPTWELATIDDIDSIFSLIYNGVIDECKSRSRDTVNLVLRDKQERLNGPVTERLIGTTGTWASGQTNQDVVRPIVFGEVHNITPILIDPSTLTYLFNDGYSEGITEIRDNGYPIYTRGGIETGAVVNNSQGTFTLTSPASGTITCSVQGVYKSNIGYTNNVVDIIQLLVTSYGQPTKRFAESEIDISGLSALSASFVNIPAMGYVVLDRENLLETIQTLAYSIGCQVYINRQGLLQLLRLGSPFSNPNITDITASDMYAGSFSISNRPDILGSIKLAYCKNWTVQSNITTAIPDSNKDAMSTEWLIETVTDPLTVSTYRLTTEPIQRDSYLITTLAANEEATRLLNYYKLPRTVYTFTGTSKLLGLKLGQQVTLTHPRFGLGSGKTGQVISLSPNWSKSTIEVEVMV